ncbi:hypothetical protein HY837_04235 [archaeon]|nr:hypothetical protein [archaeon]
MGRMTIGWNLTKESFKILLKDKEILWFPIFSGIINLLLFAGMIFTFLFPLFKQETVTLNERSVYLALVIYYLITFFVVTFFNSAVITCASIRLKGGDPTVMDGLKNALKHKGKIFLWSLVGATVGIILKSIEDKSENLGKFLAGVLGIVWSLSTYFIIPVLIFEDKSTFESVKRSGSLFKKTWGENVAGQFSMSIIIMFAVLAGFIPLILSLLFNGSFVNEFNFMIAIISSLVYFVVHALIVAIIGATLGGIYTAALYNYATTGKVSKEYSQELVKNAFKKK